MAATATESVKFSTIAATTAAFALRGGHYALKATGAFDVGDVVLQALSIDGSTWVPVGSPITAATYITFDLPPGHYRIAVVPDATAVFAALTSVPL